MQLDGQADGEIPSAASSASAARVWEEAVVIPTYGVGEPDRNPMFLEKRVYQGSSGAVYPMPVIDKILDEKRDKIWNAVFLENRYLKIMILPELGGRVQMALDKTNGHHFVYYNRVIKPALVGLAGPWISGGIEFNWPQHHRPTTYMPVEHSIQQHADGSATVWLSEIDRMQGTKSLCGLTLRPDRAVLEVSVRLYNRTPLPQTFLWWANPAIHVDEHHQSIFPPDVHAVMDHGKRDVSSFPVATGTYYKVNYASGEGGGTDISRYKNLPVPTSYMAYHSSFDFVAAYDHRKRAGLLHVADHSVSPGKKQWTWGCGDFGQAWDRQLTDEDGPYVELMCGVYTDNQPDFSWLAPFEEKTFTQYFMPYKQIGAINNATREAAIALDVKDGQASVGAYATSVQNDLLVELTHGGNALLAQRVDLSPELAFEATVSLPPGIRGGNLRLTLRDSTGRPVVSSQPGDNREPIPSPAQAALPPQKIESTEQLFLTGQHLEQYRHATCDPEPYYREALRREPDDARNNNALGLLLYRRGEFREAEQHFRAAIKTLTARNPNPRDGESYYLLGLSLRMLGRMEEAADAFQKATWSAAQQSSAYFELAQLAAMRGDWSGAVELCGESLVRNAHHHKARVLKAALLRRQNRLHEAQGEANFVRSLDLLDFGALNEQHLIAAARGKPAAATQFREELVRAMRGEPHNTIELALDYASAGLSDEAIEVLERLLPHGDENRDTRDVYPMLYYLCGWIRAQAGDERGALEDFQAAGRQSPRLCFPHRLEEMLALQMARQRNPDDGFAAYYLGNLLYSKRNHEPAIAVWETARTLCPSFPTVHRNLALAYFNKRRDPSAALAAMERAFELDPTDARVLFELDQLYRKLNRPPPQRLALLDQHPELVEQRDDLAIERIWLLLKLERFDEARQLLPRRTFHPWEGGEGRVSGAYVASLLGIAKRHLAAGEYEAGLVALEQARVYPDNLGEGKLYGALENDLDYFAALALRRLGREAAANACFERATQGLGEPVSAVYYNDQPPHQIFYQGLALRELGREVEAQRRFRKLIDYGRQHLHDTVAIDYFAVSLPEFLVFDDDLDRRNRVHCHYMMGLGHLGLGENPEARKMLGAVLDEDAAHLGAAVHLRIVENGFIAAKSGQPPVEASTRRSEPATVSSPALRPQAGS